MGYSPLGTQQAPVDLWDCFLFPRQLYTLTVQVRRGPPAGRLGTGPPRRVLRLWRNLVCPRGFGQDVRVRDLHDPGGGREGGGGEGPR